MIPADTTAASATGGTLTHKERIQRLQTALQAAKDVGDNDLEKSFAEKQVAAQAERSDARPLELNWIPRWLR